MSDTSTTDPTLELRSKTTLTHIIYALYALSFLTGLSAIAAIIINYVKRDDVKGTVLESHFNWQIRTFWWGLLWGVIGFITMFIGIGFIILAANAIWIIYRIIKGWLRLNDGLAVE
jgi:uncharacterized membrane protein